MVVRKMMTNIEIYNTANALVELFQEFTSGETEAKFPVKVNFYFQKNMNTLVAMAKELEEERANIIRKYGTPSEDDANQIVVPEDKLEDANKELNDLFALEQEVAINTIDLECFDGIEMTQRQVVALTFMISEE